MCKAKKTIIDYLRTLADQKPNKLLLGGEDGWKSGEEILRMTERIAQSFLSMGLCPGEPVLLRADKNTESAVLLLALRAAGLLVVLADPRGDIKDILGGCEVRIPLRAVVERVSGLGWTVRMDGREELLSLDTEMEVDTPFCKLPETTATEAAFVIFTSGSCGKSKAVVISENNLISNLIASNPLGDYRKEDIALGALPLVHVFGLVLLFGVFVLDYRLFFLEKTDIPSILACIEKEKISRMNGVPALYLAMAERSKEYDLSSLRCGFIGGGPITAEQFVSAEDKLGMTLIPVYGMSENIGIACSNSCDAREIRAVGASKFYPENRISILTEDGREAHTGEEGEIWVAGPMRMLGYYERPMPEDQLFATGDLGYVDAAGFLHLSGRKKQIIIRNGNNISPRRIEEALLRLPEIKAAAVVGIPDEKQGEVPCAMIVGRVDMEKLRELLHKNELPTRIMAVEALPMTASGKTDLQKVKEILNSVKTCSK